MPSAAPLRRIAPTLVWSTMSSSTSTGRAPAEHVGHARAAAAARSEASAPRCTWKPVTSSASASDTTKQGASVRREHVGQPVQPARRHQERPGRVAGLDRPAYDLLALGQEQPVLRLEVRPELDVAQVAVVGQPWVGGVGDLDQRRHRVTGRRRP